jgi:ABC-2 type transport system ATP-binding protein
LLIAEHLTKRYRDGTVGLQDLELRVEAGSIYCLLGANGAGKTTTINLFLNFIRPTAGRCLIDGIDVERQPLEAKRCIGYLPENVSLYGSFTALQNLDLFARLHGRKDLTTADYEHALTEVGLPAQFFRQRVRHFSKGMRQKLAIAIAVVKQAPALILDEPLSGLDPKAASEFVDALRGQRGLGKAVLMSTHDIFRARELADVVGIMKRGRKVVELPRSELEAIDLESLYLSSMRDDAEEAA